MITRERYLQLIEVCNDARPLYMQGANTGISDELYDSYIADIREYEEKNPIELNSPTQSVNPNLEDGDVVHLIPMLSLTDVFTTESAQDFVLTHSSRTALICEYKLDGLSLQLVYRDGTLVSAATRGDGKIGVECLESVQYIDDIPKSIEYEGRLIVHGEVFMKKSKFTEYCKRYGSQANPRNTAVGILKRKREHNRSMYLSFLAFNLDNSNEIETNGFPESFHCLDTHERCMNLVSYFNIPVVSQWSTRSSSGIEDLIRDTSAERDSLDYPIDGLVLKVDSISYREELGDNGVVPKWAVAYKFPAKEIETELLSVDWQVGSTGTLTPVANLAPARVMGSTVTKATLHNRNRIKDLDLNIGDLVVIYKAGDIIPAIKSARHTEKSHPISIPTECPSCKSVLEDYVCKNIQCREKLLARLNTWADKKIGNFKGVSDSIITGLFNKGKIRIPSDFYKVKPIDVLTLPGSGRARMNTFMQRVAESKTAMTFSQVLVGLGVNDLAQSGAAKVEQYIKTAYPNSTFADAIDVFCELTSENFQSILGPVKGESIYQQLKDPFIQEVILGVRGVFASRVL